MSEPDTTISEAADEATIAAAFRVAADAVERGEDVGQSAAWILDAVRVVAGGVELDGNEVRLLRALIQNAPRPWETSIVAQVVEWLRAGADAHESFVRLLLGK